MSNLTPLHVVAAIIVDDSKALACRRAPHKAAGGKWEFPGGKVEPGENSKQALMREIAEELSIECNAIKSFDTSDTQVGSSLIRLETIICTVGKLGSLSSTDHDDFAWITSADIRQLDWAAPDLPAVALLESVSDFSILLVDPL
jgi:8-oxo-dGTP diphosphatase